MTFTRLGKRSHPSIKLEGVERFTELTEYLLEPDEGEGDIASGIGELEWWLSGEAYQSTAAGSLWRYTRQHAGEDVGFTVAPHGNTTPTASQPHYVGRVIIGPPPALGGSAVDRVFLFAFEWRVMGEPEEVTA